MKIKSKMLDEKHTYLFIYLKIFEAFFNLHKNMKRRRKNPPSKKDRSVCVKINKNILKLKNLNFMIFMTTTT